MSFEDPYCYSQPFLSMFMNSCNDLENVETDISFYDYKGGYALFSFNLTPDMDSCGAHKSPPEVGVLTVRAEFSKANDRPFMLIFILEHERCIVIDRDRNVTVE